MSGLRRNFIMRLATGAGAVVAGNSITTNVARSTSREDIKGTATVLDFMSPEMRRDALSKAPLLNHTLAMQAALNDGVSALTVPEGVVVRLTAPLIVKRKILLTGGGELRFTAGVANTAAITVCADGCEFDGVLLTNPNLLQAQAGDRNVR